MFQKNLRLDSAIALHRLAVRIYSERGHVTYWVVRHGRGSSLVDGI